MYITEKQNVSESILFLGCARMALKGIVEASSIDNKKELCNFILKEASDYEIMHLLVNEELPTKKVDYEHELALFSTLKEQIINTLPTLLESFEFSFLNTFIHEIDSVYPRYTSALPLLEQKLLIEKEEHKLLQEDIGPPQLAKDVVLGLKIMGKGFKAAAGSPEIAAAKKGLQTIAKVGGETVSKAIEAGKTQLAIKKLTDAGLPRNLAIKVINAKKQFIAAGGLSGYMAKLGGAATAAAKTAGAGLASGASAAKAGLVSAGAATKGAAASIKSGAALAALKTKAAGATAAVKAALASNTAVGAGTVLGAAALAALAIYASYKTYKRFFSKAAKACAKLPSKQKTACMKKFQADAIGKQIQDLTASIAGCAKVKNPEKCKVGIQNKINKLKIKQAKVLK